MANTVIQLKKAPSTGAVPTNLANGEIGLDHFTGNLWFKAANGAYRLINAPGGAASYGTVSAAGSTLVAATAGDILTISAGRGIEVTGVAANDTVFIAATQTKSISIPSPTAADNVTLFYTDTDITINKIASVLQGIANSNVVFRIQSAASRSNTSPKQIVTNGIICANINQGVITTSFDQAMINANSWVWLTTSFANGGTTEIAVTMEY